MYIRLSTYLSAYFKSLVSDSATLWTVACQTPLSMGILQTRILEWAAMPPPGNLPDPGIKRVSLVSCTGRQALYNKRHLGSWKKDRN